MQLLDVWRYQVVRVGKRLYTAEDGTEYRMSLQNTCLSCHSNKIDFCDRCHDYAGVTPDCWTCHLEPEELAMKINRRISSLSVALVCWEWGLYRPRRVWAERCCRPAREACRQKWALAVDLKKCWAGQQAGCRDCIDACKAHNIPQIKDAKEEIKWIWLAPLEKCCPIRIMSFAGKYQENSVVTLCNHCENRPVSGCVPPRPLFKIRRE